MADDTEIEQMLDEKMRENGEKKEKKHKKHKHHKSHKSEKKHDRKRSRSRSPLPLPTSGKRTNVNSELHQIAESIARRPNSKERSSKSSRRETTPELTPEERDLRTVFCKKSFAILYLIL